MFPNRGLVLVTLGLLGCPNTINYRAADVQVDFPATMPADAETVRICVAGAGVQNVGAKFNGRFAMPALPVGRPLDIVADVLGPDETLLLQGWANGAEGHVEGEIVDCLVEDCALCQAEGRFATAGEEAWVLAIRFFE
jgi:hypothetical protein